MSVWTVFYARIPAGIYLRVLIFAGFFWLTSLPALVLTGVSLSDFSQVRRDFWQSIRLHS